MSEVDYYDVQAMIRDARSEIRGETARLIADLRRDVLAEIEGLGADLSREVASIRRTLDERTAHLV